MIEIHFSIQGHDRNYVVHRQEDGNLEILYEDNRQRVQNQKEICRAYGLEVSTGDTPNSHAAIRRLAEQLVQDI